MLSFPRKDNERLGRLNPPRMIALFRAGLPVDQLLTHRLKVEEIKTLRPAERGGGREADYRV
ncbi:MAG TPA: hypothetical protein VGG77_15805 [Roseiarcus sp.]